MDKKKAISFLTLFAAVPVLANGVDRINGLNLSDSSRIHDLDEVVVVSQPKESFRLRQQSLSSNIFTNKEMSRLGIHDLRELSVYVPSFVMPNYGSRITSSMYVRGIGSRVNSPALGIYSDGMPIMSKSAFNYHFYDVNRVDILRGAQGTLYGQNTEGGLIRIYSKNPFDYQGTDFKLGLGSRLYRNAEISHYNKVNNNFAFSVGGFYDGQNGFFRNQTTGERADKYNEAGGKLRLLYRPTDRLSFDYIADYQYVDQNGFPYGKVEEDGTTSFPNTNRQSLYRRNVFNTAFTVGFKANAFDLTNVLSYQYLKDYMLMDQDYLPEDYMHLEQRQLQNAMTEELTLKSRDAVGGFWHWAVGGFFSAQWLKTNAPVYFDSEMNKMLSANITSYAYNGMLNAMAARLIAKGIPAEQAINQMAGMIEKMGGCTINMDMGVIPGIFRTPTYNLAFYHESNFDLSSRLVATLGLRYDFSQTVIDYATSAEVKLDENVMGQNVKASITSNLNRREHNNYVQLLPKFGLNYKLNNGSNIYATIAKGYRAGGYNIQMFSDIFQTELSAAAQKARGQMSLDDTHNDQYYENIANTISYKPETSWNYEVGTHLNLFNHALHFDVAAYYMQVKNQQLSVMAGNYGFGRMMVNAGKSHSCGVETTLRGNVFDNHLSWAVSYGYTRALFDDYVDSVNVGGKKKAVDYKDKYVPYVPQHTYAVMADYIFDVQNSKLRTITLGFNLNGQGKTYWDEENTSEQKLYHVLGAHADADFGFMKISFWGKNLTNTKYNTFAVESAATGKKYTFAQLGNPFQCGVDLKFHF